MVELKKIVIISGPTASGKSRLAIELVLMLKELGLELEVLSADSAQVYRYMDIGTDKLSDIERKGVPHHLIDIVNPDEHFDARMFQEQADAVIERLHNSNKFALLVGGTGFYIRALLYGLCQAPGRDETIRDELEKMANERGRVYLHRLLAEVDPESARRIHPNDLKRVIRALEVYRISGRKFSDYFVSDGHLGKRYEFIHIGLLVERNLLYKRIDMRVDEMMKKGFLDEVKKLREMGYGLEHMSQNIIGYKQLHQYLDGGLSFSEAISEIKKQTRHYARRQLIWLRGEKELIWLDPELEKDKIKDKIIKFLSEKGEK